jgi:hypothetical protein
VLATVTPSHHHQHHHQNQHHHQHHQMEFDDLDLEVVDADDGAGDINNEDQGGEAGEVSIVENHSDDGGAPAAVTKKKAWGRPEGANLSEQPSQVVDDLETIDEWRQSLMVDKDLWPNGWWMVEAGPAKTSWWIDKYGIYMQKGAATIHEETSDEYYWHCLASERCRRLLMQVTKKG